MTNEDGKYQAMNANIFESSEYKSLVHSHQLYMSQTTTDLSNWQDLCSSLLALFKLFSESPHSSNITQSVPELEASLA